MKQFKTTHVGSLPRPQEMITKTLRKQPVTREDLEQYLHEIVEKQLTAGIDIISNGELPRTDYVTSTVSRISGFNGSATAPMPEDLEKLPEFSRRFSGRNGLITLNPKIPVKLPACTQPLSYTGETSLREELDMMKQTFDSLKAKFPDTAPDVFFTSPSPGTVALFMANEYYPDYRAYIEQIGSILKKEYDIISEYGFQLQVDCPDLAMGRHTGYKHLSDDAFIDLIHTNVQVLNQALSSINPDLCRTHICWGNYAGTHHCDIDFKKIFDPIMAINVRHISVEASNHRHSHEWTIFREFKLPEDKVLMPGVIDTSTNTIEHPDLVAQRIANYADLLGVERVIACTDCGFATTASASNVSGEVAWMKLETLVEGAKRAARQYR